METHLSVTSGWISEVPVWDKLVVTGQVRQVVALWRSQYIGNRPCQAYVVALTRQLIDRWGCTYKFHCTGFGQNPYIMLQWCKVSLPHPIKQCSKMKWPVTKFDMHKVSSAQRTSTFTWQIAAEDRQPPSCDHEFGKQQSTVECYLARSWHGLELTNKYFGN